MRFTIQTQDFDKLAKRLAKNADQAEKALKATGNDMKKRVPGWAATEVTEVYNIKKKEITPQKDNGAPRRTAGNIRVTGQTVTNVVIRYTGRVLTPTHFGMRPKALTPTAKGRKKRRPITAEIKKGQRKSLGPHVFLGSNRGGGYIPFKRTTNKAYPIESVKTLSRPQMIDNPEVQDKIIKKINSELPKRLEHNVKRFFK